MQNALFVLLSESVAMNSHNFQDVCVKCGALSPDSDSTVVTPQHAMYVCCTENERKLLPVLDNITC